MSEKYYYSFVIPGFDNDAVISPEYLIAKLNGISTDSMPHGQDGYVPYTIDTLIDDFYTKYSISKNFQNISVLYSTDKYLTLSILFVALSDAISKTMVMKILSGELINARSYLIGILNLISESASSLYESIMGAIDPLYNTEAYNWFSTANAKYTTGEYSINYNDFERKTEKYLNYISYSGLTDYKIPLQIIDTAKFIAGYAGLDKDFTDPNGSGYLSISAFTNKIVPIMTTLYTSDTSKSSYYYTTKVLGYENLVHGDLTKAYTKIKDLYPFINIRSLNSCQLLYNYLNTVSNFTSYTSSEINNLENTDRVTMLSGIDYSKTCALSMLNGSENVSYVKYETEYSDDKVFQTLYFRPLFSEYNGYDIGIKFSIDINNGNIALVRFDICDFSVSTSSSSIVSNQGCVFNSDDNAYIYTASAYDALNFIGTITIKIGPVDLLAEYTNNSKLKAFVDTAYSKMKSKYTVLDSWLLTKSSSDDVLTNTNYHLSDSVTCNFIYDAATVAALDGINLTSLLLNIAEFGDPTIDIFDSSFNILNLNESEINNLSNSTYYKPKTDANMQKYFDDAIAKYSGNRDETTSYFFSYIIKLLACATSNGALYPEYASYIEPVVTYFSYHTNTIDLLDESRKNLFQNIKFGNSSEIATGSINSFYSEMIKLLKSEVYSDYSETTIKNMILNESLVKAIYSQVLPIMKDSRMDLSKGNIFDTLDLFVYYVALCKATSTYSESYIDTNLLRTTINLFRYAQHIYSIRGEIEGASYKSVTYTSLTLLRLVFGDIEYAENNIIKWANDAIWTLLAIFIQYNVGAYIDCASSYLISKEYGKYKNLRAYIADSSEIEELNESVSIGMDMSMAYTRVIQKTYNTGNKETKLRYPLEKIGIYAKNFAKYENNFYKIT